MKPERPALFFDRDGTLLREVDFLTRVEQVELLPGAAAAIQLCNQHGLPAVVVTNQSGVARGLLTEAQLDAVHRRLATLLADAGARIDGVLYCPHHPDQGAPPYRRPCACRKPQPGLLLEAAARWPIDLAASVMIGDSLRDVEAGHRAGCRSVLVLTGYGARERRRLEGDNEPLRRPDHIASDILQAVHWSLEICGE